MSVPAVFIPEQPNAMLQFRIDSPERLPEVAEQLVEALDGRTVILFRGEMGAGKTTLIKEIVAALGSEDHVVSPTFALVNSYADGTGEPVYHFDFYRIDRPEEAYDLGYEEYFYSGALCLVEWPEKIEALLPDDAMTVQIRIEANGDRTITAD